MNIDTKEIHAKGLYTRNLTSADMWQWWHGTPPAQHQVQLQRFWQLSNEAPMFKDRIRRGTDPWNLQTIVLNTSRRFTANA